MGRPRGQLLTGGGRKASAETPVCMEHYRQTRLGRLVVMRDSQILFLFSARRLPYLLGAGDGELSGPAQMEETALLERRMRPRRPQLAKKIRGVRRCRAPESGGDS